MLSPQGRPIILASPKIEGLICLSLEMLKSGTLLLAKRRQPPANSNAPLPGYGNHAPAYVVTTWCASLAQAQYSEARAADRAARANRANTPPQQHYLSQGTALEN
jgi:hypothetical protein